MEEYLQPVLHYLLGVTLTTLEQLLFLFVPFLLLALIMHFAARASEQLSVALMGVKPYLLLFGWLGTAMHELGHALFALLFGHKITDMRLFSPNPKSGSLGYVSHTWNHKNLYHIVGNFFIGIGPIIMGCIVLYLLATLLFSISIPDMPLQLIKQGGTLSFDGIWRFITEIFTLIWQFFVRLFTGTHASWWKILIFLYLTFTIGSSVTLSPADIKTALRGFLVMLLLVFLFNLSTFWLGNFALNAISKVPYYVSWLYFLLLLAILLNLGFSLVLWVAWKLREEIGT